MTVREQIQKHFETAPPAVKRRVNTVWLCPNIVRNISLNSTIQHVFRLPISGVISEELAEKEVTKQWYEENMLCLIYFNEK